jgi:hypothetical protein
MRRIAPTACALTLGVLAVTASPTRGQVALTAPTASFPEDFGSVQTVRELPDGRVLVADPLGMALFLVDLEAGTRTVVGSEGQGPEEYRQPDAVWPLPGDSTLLVDLGNGRLVALGPDLSFGPTTPIAMSDFQPGQPGQELVLALPQGVDGQGHVFSRLMGGLGGPLADSADIVRIDRATRSHERVASFKLGERKQSTSGGANNRNVQISNIPLSPEDAWGVGADGSVVIARAGDYHVEWHRPDGSVARGKSVPFEPVSIRTAEKEAWVAAQGRTGGGIGVSVMVQNGSVQMGFQRGGAGGGRREIDQYEWPDVMAPFYQGRIPVDGQGRAWVRRHRRAGAPALYDVFGADGDLVGSVTLPEDGTIVGFGQATIYVVTYDEFDLNYLERYAMPAL